MTQPDPNGFRHDAARRAVRALIGSAREGRGGALVIRGHVDVEAGTGDDIDLDASAIGPSKLISIDPTRNRTSALGTPEDDPLSRAADDANPDRFALAVRLHRILTDLADDGPITVVVDDADQLDDASAAALAFVARRIGEDPIALIIRRTEDGSPSPLDDLTLVEATPPTRSSTRRPAGDGEDENLERLLLAAEHALDQALMDAAAPAVDALARRDPKGIDRARYRLAEGRLSLLTGEGVDPTRAFKEAIRLASSVDTPVAVRTATRARLDLVQVYLRAGRVHLAAAVGDELTAIGGAEAELVVTATQAARGDRAAVDAIQDQAERVIAEGGVGRAGFVADTAGLALIWGEQYATANRLLDRLARTTRLADAIGPLPVVLGVQAIADLRQSRYPSASARADEAVRFADATGRPGLAAFPASVLAVAEAIRGDEAGCRLAASRLVEFSAATGRDRGPAATEVPARAAMGLLHLGLDRPQQAVAHLEPLITLTGTTPWLVMWQTDLAEALVRSGRHDEAKRITEAFISGLGSVRNARARAAAARAEALLCEERDPAEAELLLQGSEQMLRKAGPPFSLARTLLARGRLRIGQGRRTEATADLEEALDIFGSMGAQGWEAQTKRALADAASDTTGAVRGPAPVAAPTPLTPQELQVVALVATGMTNREIAGELFVSTRTVDSHLGRINTKLGITTRSELTARADRWGLRPTH